MQNKANFQKSQMNVSIFSKKAYENKSNWTLGENKPNSNPIKANLKRAKMNVNSLITKDYRKNDAFAVQKNKPNSNPIRTQSKPILERMNVNFCASREIAPQGCKIITGVSKAHDVSLGDTADRRPADLRRDKRLIGIGIGRLALPEVSIFATVVLDAPVRPFAKILIEDFPNTPPSNIPKPSSTLYYQVYPKTSTVLPLYNSPTIFGTIKAIPPGCHRRVPLLQWQRRFFQTLCCRKDMRLCKQEVGSLQSLLFFYGRYAFCRWQEPNRGHKSKRPNRY